MAGDFEEEIASYDKGLKLKPDFPPAWCNRGLTVNSLGRHEEEITSYDKPLKYKHDPNAWYNWGVSLGNLGRYEEAIASYDKALEYKPDDHDAWCNRGIALGTLGRCEEAIASYDKALEYKPNAFGAWYNRGVALGTLGRYEEAIASYDKALEYKPDDHNAWYGRGFTLDDLGRCEEAIASFDKALAYKPDYSQAWIDRGFVLGNLNRRATLSIPRYPVEAAALNQPGYGGKLATLQEGLKYVLRESNPQGWGQLHQAMGGAHYFEGRRRGNPFPMWRDASREYQLALEVLTEQAFPEDHLETLEDMIQVYLGLGRTEKAWGLVQAGSELLQRLISESPSPGKLEQLALKFSSFDQFTVDRLVQQGNPLKALTIAERAKNAFLARFLGNTHDDEFSYEVVQQTLLNSHTAALYCHLSPYALTCFLLTPHNSTPQVLTVSPSPAAPLPEVVPEAMIRLQNWEKWVEGWDQCYDHYRATESPDKQIEHSWQTAMPDRLAQLRTLLDIPQLEAKAELGGITHLILIPHRDLHRFPLHALFSQPFTTTTLPSLQVGIILHGRSPSPITAGDRFLSLENPQHQQSEGTGTPKKLLPLPFAEVESDLLCHKFTGDVTRLGTTHATQDAIVHTLKQRTHDILHFTGHGAYSFHNPGDSCLFLSGGDRLTAHTISRLDLSAVKLVALSACETAVTGNQTITTEYVGLVSAFLQAGVCQVLCTLWTVQSESSALFMVEFYNQLLQGIPAPQALHYTQLWLQTATREDLANWLNRELNRITTHPKTLQTQDDMETCRNKLNTLESTPYKHPYHWAAFTLAGL